MEWKKRRKLVREAEERVIMANMSGNLWMLQNKGDEMEPGTKEKLMNVIERMRDYVRE